MLSASNSIFVCVPFLQLSLSLLHGWYSFKVKSNLFGGFFFFSQCTHAECFSFESHIHGMIYMCKNRFNFVPFVKSDRKNETKTVRQNQTQQNHCVVTAQFFNYKKSVFQKGKLQFYFSKADCFIVSTMK